MLSRLMTRKEQFVLLFLGGTILLGAGVLWWRSGAEGEASMVTPADAPPPAALEFAGEPAPLQVAASPARELPVAAEIVVSVQGAVLNPGVYRMTSADRVDDLFRKAGGALPSADLRDINRAARLIDGTTLTVPSNNQEFAAQAVANPTAYTLSGWEQSATAQPQSGEDYGSFVNSFTAGGVAGGKIDLNRADQATLETLPGIGPVLASSIVRFREEQPFRSVEDLQLVSGIGEKRLAAIRDFVTVSNY